MHEICSRLEDDGIGNLDTTSIAGRLDTWCTRYIGHRADHRAQWQRTHVTYRIEVAKGHDDGR
jgi:hypothetical protein